MTHRRLSAVVLYDDFKKFHIRVKYNKFRRKEFSDLSWLSLRKAGSSWGPRFNSHLGPQFSFLFPNCTNVAYLLFANFNDTIQSKLNPSKKNGISKKQNSFETKGTSPGIELADTRSLAKRHTNELLWQREAAVKF